eukprot:5303484-Prymnesium_polylepis.1
MSPGAVSGRRCSVRREAVSSATRAYIELSDLKICNGVLLPLCCAAPARVDGRSRTPRALWGATRGPAGTS